ncbi:MAG TPA: hypothetical protein VII44_04175, partial [Puia sp.]
MSNLSDKDIDRLSREAADFYEPDHSSLSWKRLEQKLIEQIPERPPDGFRFGRINPFIWGSAVVLIAGVSFFFIKNINYSQHSTRTSQPVIQNIPSSTADNKKAIVTNDRKNLDLPKQPNAMADAGAIPVSVVGTHSNAGASTDPLAGGSAKYLSQNSNTEGSNKNSGKKGSGSKNKNLAAIAPSGIIASNGTDISNAANTATTNNANASDNSNSIDASTTSRGSKDIMGTQRTRTQLSLPLIASSGAALGRVKGNDSLLNQLSHSRAPFPYKSLRVNRSLNFGLAFGPDYTDAGGITNNQLGNNIGLTVGYYLTNKLSVNSGVFYSNKFYWAPGRGTGISNYARGPLLNGNVTTAAAPAPIEYINGSANMWELPLTLRYDFAKNEKTKFFMN